MRNKKTGRQLSRTRNQRRALMKTLLGSLILHERITTTEAKAKEIKNNIDQVVSKAKVARTDKTKEVATLRDLRKYIPKVAMEKIVGEFGARFDDRQSGFIRIIKLEARKSDSARMAIIEFV